MFVWQVLIIFLILIIILGVIMTALSAIEENNRLVRGAQYWVDPIIDQRVITYTVLEIKGGVVKYHSDCWWLRDRRVFATDRCDFLKKVGGYSGKIGESKLKALRSASKPTSLLYYEALTEAKNSTAIAELDASK